MMTYEQLIPILQLLQPLLSQYLGQQGKVPQPQGKTQQLPRKPITPAEQWFADRWPTANATVPGEPPGLGQWLGINPLTPVGALPRMQFGGIATRPTLVGESGRPELVLPLSGVGNWLGGSMPGIFAPQMPGPINQPRPRTYPRGIPQNPRMPIYPPMKPKTRQSIYITNPVLDYLDTAAGSW